MVIMADDKSKTGPADGSRINIHEDYEVQYWSEKLRCTKEALERAVEKVGPMADAVKKELRGEPT